MSFNLVSRSTSLSAVRGDGLQLITSASFSAVSSVSVDGCFTSTYDNYRVLLVLTSPATSDQVVNLRMRASSTDDTSSTYDTGVSGPLASNASYNATLYGTSGSASNVMINHTATTPNIARLEFYHPALAEYTRILTHIAHSTVATGSLSGSGALHHRTATAYDGFTIYPTSGTITGSIHVHGYRNN